MNDPPELMTSADSVSPVVTSPEPAGTAGDLALIAPPPPRGRAWVLGPIAVGLALCSAFATFIVLSDLTPLAPTHRVVVTLLLINALTGFLLLGIVSREVWQIVQARRRRRAGARLHVRIVGLFSIIAAAPAILVAVVASVTLDRGLDRLFSTRTRAVIENSLIVAEAYVREHGEMIRGDIMAMAFDVSRARPLFDQDRARFKQFFTAQAQVRGLPVAEIVDSNVNIIEKADIKFNGTVIEPAKQALVNVNDTQPQIALILEANYVAAIIKLRNYDNYYLHVARPLDPRIVQQLSATRESVSEYAALEARRLGVQIAFALMYTVIALSVLLSAVWIGLNFANLLVAPIRRLIGAANLVSTGNLHIQVPIRHSEGDLAHLSETFNKMTQELRTQRDDLMRASDQIDSRRRFTEAVLAGASAGVIGVDGHGNISILNRSAEHLIGFSEAQALGKPLAEIVPELADVLSTARSGTRLVQGQIVINRDRRERNLSVRVTSERSDESNHGYVITLDDITDLVVAQRSSAWADIARRIAHEIKNPLTPIQLSAERLRRKYGKVIVEDAAVFTQCTDTIVRQVDDIKRMVDEFSRFARMPKPVMSSEDVAEVVRQTVFLMRVGHPDIDLNVEISEETMPARLDRRLIAQALTNIIKNAAEAIAAVPPADLERGRINVTAFREGEHVIIDVVDNGIGLPQENRSRLLEPYVTTREKGTGLGLAIVGRILEEHGGGIELSDASVKIPGARGAWIRLRFRAEPVATDHPTAKVVAGE
jgi:two-component system nitrogen regulation sensor histidine kinase NtrY